MNYRKDKYGNDISILGYGCMRFSRSGGKVDVDKAEEEILAAFRGGVNYYDTAYVYPGSEAALGEILERNHIRGQVAIATKLPHYLIKAADSMEKYFREQLRRLRTDYVDYYLMHMLTDVQTWERLKGLGVVEWLEEKRNSGEIRQVGFSYHGNSDMFCQLVDEYHWDFCQIQYNYMDEHTQAGRAGLLAAAEKGVPVIIMEPVKGGMLATPPQPVADILQAAEPETSLASWAIRFAANLPGVITVLSGMSNLAQMQDNLAYMQNFQALTASQQETLQKAQTALSQIPLIPCTNCNYCAKVCPMQIGISGSFTALNYLTLYGDKEMAAGQAEWLVSRQGLKPANECIKCGKCEEACPQHIAIRENLLDVTQKLLKN